MSAAEIAALGEISRRIGSMEGKLEDIAQEQADQGGRLRRLEDIAVADQAVAARVASIRADGTITKRWVIQVLIAFVVALTSIAGFLLAVTR